VSYKGDKSATFENKNTYFSVSKTGKIYEFPSSNSKINKAIRKKGNEINQLQPLRKNNKIGKAL